MGSIESEDVFSQAVDKINTTFHERHARTREDISPLTRGGSYIRARGLQLY